MNARTARYHLEQTLYYLRNVGNIVHELNVRLSELDDIDKDYRHEHELAMLSAMEMTKLFLKERELLRERRILLFELESMKGFKKLYDDNPDIKGIIANTVGNMNAIDGRQRNAEYVPRKINGLKCVKRQYRPMHYFKGEAKL